MQEIQGEVIKIGLYTDFIVKNPKLKFWITVSLDVLIIFSLLFFAFKIKGEYQKGWDACWNQSCAICSYSTYATAQNFPTENKLPANFTNFTFPIEK